MKSLGQIAYEAYATKVDWKSPFTGQTLKEWDTLMIMNPIVAEAWECAALMVAGPPRVKIGPEQTQMSTIALMDTRHTIRERALALSSVRMRLSRLRSKRMRRFNSGCPTATSMKSTGEHGDTTFDGWITLQRKNNLCPSACGGDKCAIADP
jgi:hypothetical protein